MKIFKKLFTFLTVYSGLVLSGWWLVTFSATHVPLSQDTSGLPYADKVVQVLIYMGLAFLLSLWLQTRYSLQNPLRVPILVVVLILTYAVLDESLQSLVGRTPDLLDGTADVVGMIVGLLLWTWLRRSLEFYTGTLEYWLFYPPNLVRTSPSRSENLSAPPAPPPILQR